MEISLVHLSIFTGMSSWFYILFNGLQPMIFIIYLFLLCLPLSWPVGVPPGRLLCAFLIFPSHFEHVFTSGTTRHSRLILYFPAPAWRVLLPCREECCLETQIQEVRCDHWCWSVPQALLGDRVKKYIHVCLHIGMCTHKVAFIFTY